MKVTELSISICWNLLKGEIHSKPSTLNKDGSSTISILLTAKPNCIREGGFDNATDSYEELIVDKIKVSMQKIQLQNL